MFSDKYLDDGTSKPPSRDKVGAIKQWNERQRRTSMSADQFLKGVADRALGGL